MTAWPDGRMDISLNYLDELANSVELRPPMKSLQYFFSPYLTAADLRHTNATLMLKAGIPAKIASERLGNSNIGITLGLYSHVMKEMQQDAAEKINDILFIKEQFDLKKIS